MAPTLMRSNTAPRTFRVLDAVPRAAVDGHDPIIGQRPEIATFPASHELGRRRTGKILDHRCSAIYARVNDDHRRNRKPPIAVAEGDLIAAIEMPA